PDQSGARNGFDHGIQAEADKRNATGKCARKNRSEGFEGVPGHGEIFETAPTTKGRVSINRDGLRSNALFLDHRRAALTPAQQQIGTNESINIAIKYAIDIANFVLRAMVFDHSIRLKDIRPNLRTE